MIYQRINNNFLNHTEKTVYFYIKDVAVGILKAEVANTLAENCTETFFLKTLNNKTTLHLNVKENANFKEISETFNSCLLKLQQINLISKIRNEDFFVRSLCCSQIVAKADRAVMPLLGMPSFGIHINCYQENSEKMWIAKRSANTYTHPNKLDNLVGGGVNALNGILSTMHKEAFEEAFILKDLSKKAKFAELMHYESHTQGSNNVRNDYLYIFDLKLPESFTPVNQDNENQSFLLLSTSEIQEIIFKEDVFKFNSELVVLSFLLRNNKLKDEKLLNIIEKMVV